MRRKGKLPLKKKYFHTKSKIDKKDIAFLKRKVETLKQKKIRHEAEKKENFGINND